MRCQLYLHETTRNYYKTSILSFQKIFNDRLFTTFYNIEDEAETFTEEYYQKLGSMPGDDSIDMSDLAEIALDKGIIFYSELKLVKYEFTAISISSLYHLWEQQTRKFLFDELSHDFKINFTEFCSNNIKDIKHHFKFHNVDIEALKTWKLINELRLMSNVIKHGNGRSANQLFKRNKNLFKKDEINFDQKLPLDTTLLEETLNISQELFNLYANNLVEFWVELPERSYSDDFEPK